MNIKVIDGVALLSFTEDDLKEIVSATLEPGYLWYWDNQYNDTEQFMKCIESEPEKTIELGIIKIMDEYILEQYNTLGRFDPDGIIA